MDFIILLGNSLESFFRSLPEVQKPGMNKKKSC
jgi:hypothetical protein